MSLNHKIPTLSLFIDISKTFESINHSFLLDKLYCMGFRGLVHSWLSDYISLRFQNVEVNGKQSNYSKISCGVPLGSILGLLLFLLYINDLSIVSNKLSFSLLADDTTILSLTYLLKIVLILLKLNLLMFLAGLLLIKLMINFNKTYYILFGNSYIAKDAPLLICNHMLLKELKIQNFWLYL